MPICPRVRFCCAKPQWMLLLTLCGLLLHGAAWADVTVAQRRELNTVKTLLRRAKQLESKGDLAEASQLVRKIQDRLTTLLGAADDALRKQVTGPFQDFVKLHDALELAGISIGSYQPLDRLVRGENASAAFSKTVAPILLNKCGRCHVERQQGGVSMETYAALMQGPAAGRIVLPEDADGSRLIEVIETGDMPRGGLKVTKQELAILKQWIREGAGLDGEDRQVRLASLVPDAPAAKEIQVAKATGSETVSFSRDLAQVLDQRCGNCHGSNGPRARLNLTTFQGLLRGGDNGPPLLPGNPDESLLIQKLKGTADGQPMPQGGPPLTDDVVAQFETWIREGARFDEADPNQSVREIAAISKARLATHAELRPDREQLALDNWRLVMPDAAPQKLATEHFLLLGNVDASELDEYASVAEELVPRVAKTFLAPTDQPLVKGAMTLFFFKSSYDYGEIGRMVEKRDADPTTHAHFRYSIVDAYAALHVARAEVDSLEVVLAQQITGLYVSSLGHSPDWFRRGTAHAAAARLVPRSDLVTAWNEQSAEAFLRMQKPDDFLAGRTTAVDSDLLAYSFVRFLMSDSRRFQKLVSQLREGHDFDASFTQAWGAAPDQIAVAWARRTASDMQRRGRRKR